MLKRLAQKYLLLGTVADGVAYSVYKEMPNSVLDEPFMVGEIRRVLHDLNGRSAPGPGHITNKALRNLEDESTNFLTDEINRIWKEGIVLEQ